MNVITEQQARQITGGRKPHMPIEYEQACKFLDQCIELDDAKYWSDKSDALAAWAKIYHDEDAARKAKRLKLKAYRRMGELAAELYPRKWNKVGAGLGGALPGPIKALKAAGLKQHEADWASALAKVPAEKFNRAVSSPRPPAPSAFMPKFAKGTSETWKRLSGHVGGQSLTGFRGFIRGLDAKIVAAGLTKSEAALARAAVTEIVEWLDEFEQHLPKGDK